MILAALLVATLAIPHSPARLDIDRFRLPAGAVARVGSSKFCHQYEKYQFHYSPDGKLLGCGGMGVHIWDAATGRTVLHLPAPRLDVQLVGFSDKATAVIARSLERTSRRIEFDPRRLRLAPIEEVDEYFVRVERIDVPTGRVCSSARLPIGIADSITLTPDGKHMAWVKENGTDLVLSDLATGKEVWTSVNPRMEIAPGRFTPDGRTLYWGLPDAKSSIACIDVKTGTRVAEIKTEHDEHESAWAISPDRKWLVSRNAGLVVWDATAREQWFRLPESPAAVQFSFISSDLLAVRTADATEGVDVWNVREKRRVARWAHLSGYRTAVSTTGNAAFLTPRGVQIFDPRTGEVVIESPRDDVQLEGFAPDGMLRIRWGEELGVKAEFNPHTNRWSKFAPWLAPHRRVVLWSDDDGQLRIEGEKRVLIDTATGRRLQEFPAGVNYIERAAGGIVLGASHESIEIRRPNGTRIGTIPKERQFGSTYQLIRGGRQLVVWAGDLVKTEIAIWDLATGECVSRTTVRSEMRHLQFTEDGSRFLANTGAAPAKSIPGLGSPDIRLKLFETSTGRCVQTIAEAFPHDVQTRRLSPDGRLLGLGRFDGSISVFETATGRVRYSFRHLASVDSVTFSPDGRWLVSSGSDAPILVWDVHAGPMGFPTVPPTVEDRLRAWNDLAGPDAPQAFFAIQKMAAFPDWDRLERGPLPDGLRAVRLVEAMERSATPRAKVLLRRWAESGDEELRREANSALARLKP